MTELTAETRFEAVMDRITQLSTTVEHIRDYIDTPAPSDEPKHDALFGALAKAQTEIQNAEQDAENMHWRTKYATLASVMNAIRGPLSKNGLAILQLPEMTTADKGHMLALTTILGHSSGQSISNYFTMYPPKQDPQGIGSAMTYMRRYAAMAICGIAGAADDDAEGSLAEAATITAAEADKILSLADELFGKEADALLDRMCTRVFDVEAVAKIPEGEAPVAIQNLNNMKEYREKKAAEEAKQQPEAAKPKAAKKGGLRPPAGEQE